MKDKNNPFIWSSHLTNIIAGLLGLLLISISISMGVEKTLSVVLLSIGTSIFASAIVSYLNSKYIIQQSNAIQMIEHWGIDKIFEARAEINGETNELLKNTKKLEICAMGLKGFRDAQSRLIEKRIMEGMSLRILTIDPNSDVLQMIDQTEGVGAGSTKATIESLISWIYELKKRQIRANQIEIKIYDHYPYDFYFCMDGIVFTGPYQSKTSQQTITYKFLANTLGASIFNNYFESLWEQGNNV